MKNDDVKKGYTFDAFDTFTSILQALFIVMKLGFGGTNLVMGWSWWWVFCPTWISLLLVLCIWILWAVINAALNTSE